MLKMLKKETSINGKVEYRRYAINFLLIFLFSCFLFSCSVGVSDNNNDEVTIEQLDGVKLTTPDKSKSEVVVKESTRWMEDTHLSLAEFGCKMMGVESSYIYGNADEPDSFTGNDDEGFNLYPGKPGHAYFWEKNGSNYTHVEPWEALFGDQRWADYNANKWLVNSLVNYILNPSGSTYKLYLGYLTHYIGDCAIIYHTYYTGVIDQWWSHTDYEESVLDNWIFGKRFQTTMGGVKYSTTIADANSISDAVINASKNTAKNCYQIVDIVGTDDPDWSNSTVYSKTKTSINYGAQYIAGCLVYAAKYFNNYRTSTATTYTLDTEGEESWFYVYAYATDKIYCAANWQKQYTNADIDVRIWSNDLQEYVASSTSGSDDPETLQYVVPTTGHYAICARAYVPFSGTTAVNALVIKKSNGTYMFD